MVGLFKEKLTAGGIEVVHLLFAAHVSERGCCFF